MRAAVLVVTYNSEGHIDDFLASLRAEAAATPIRVIVADNGSTDGTLDRLAAHSDIVAVRTGGNLGYAGGINAAAVHAAPADALLVLNPDLVVHPGVVATLLSRLADPRVGIAAPQVRNTDGSAFWSLRREPTIGRALGEALFGDRLAGRPAWLAEAVRDPAEYETARPVDWVSGAALLVRADVAAKVGAWDERFFLYSEETDYCRRVRQAGYEVWFDPGATVVHERGGSGTSAELVALQTVNRVRYARIHGGPLHATGTRGVAVLGALLRLRDPRHRASLGALLSTRRAAALPHATPAPRTPAWTGGGSVIVPAHDEASVIARTLAPLAALTQEGRIDVVVVPNGCRDDTAAAARSVPGVRVVEIEEASKVAALRAGDSATSALPRLYLDADVELTPGSVEALFECVSRPGVLAARPRSIDDVEGASWPVRAFHRARSRMPELYRHLWGAGAYALSAEGRARFDEFPLVTNDDLWVDRLFTDGEKAVAEGATARVRTPRTARALLATLRRTRGGNSALGAEGAARTAAALASTVRGPRSLVDAAVYTGFAITARIRASRPADSGWERDDTSRI